MIWQFAAMALQQEEGGPLVFIEPIISHVAVAPGSEGRLGVRLKVKPGWHVYWTNPGDTGLATDIKWSENKAITFSKLILPPPSQYVSEGLVSYILEGEPVVFNRFKISGSAKPGTRVNLKGRVSWLVCKESCISGSKEITQAVQVARKSAPSQNFSVLRDADIRSHTPFPGRATAKRSGDGVSLEFSFADKSQKVNRAYFFASSPELISASAAQSLKQGDGSWSLELKRSEFSTKPVLTLSGVLQLMLPQGQRNYRLDGIPIQ